MKPPAFVLTPLSQIPSKPIPYLWHPYIPQGRLVVLEGAPGTGKTWAAAGISSLFSEGHFLRGNKVGPDEPPGKILFLNMGDDPHDILRPRLGSAQANLSQVFFLGRPEGEESTALDLVELSRTLEKEKPVLLVIDPIEPFLENLDMPKDLRRFSRELSLLAKRHSCTILALRRRARGRKERERAEAFACCAGSILLATRDPDVSGRYLIVHERSEGEAEGERLGFEVRDGRFQWIFPSKITSAEPGHRGRAAAFDEARRYLLWFLGTGPRTVMSVFEAAESEGIHRKSLYRAKKFLGIRSRQGRGYWWWTLPPAEEGEQPAAVSQTAERPSAEKRATPDDPQGRRNSRPSKSRDSNPYSVLDALYELENPDDPDGLEFFTGKPNGAASVVCRCAGKGDS
ncbi:MAG: AAA family ATPase [Bdellovibrionota bacterium]